MQGSVSKVFTLQTQGPELNSHGSCMKDLKLKKKKELGVVVLVIIPVLGK